MKLVSILIAAYNAEKYFDEMLGSVRAQTYDNFEAWILDDGSTDGTHAAALRCAAADPRFKVVRWEQNRGVSDASFALFTLMRGEYWCRCDSDDVLHPDFLARRVALLEAHPEAVMASGPPEIIRGDGEHGAATANPRPAIPANTRGADMLRIMLQHNIIHTTSTLARASVTKTLMPFLRAEFRFAEDWYIWLLHFATGFDFLYDAAPAAKYRKHPANTSSKRDMFDARKAQIRLVPLVALSAAAGFSATARPLWARWRRVLWCNWLICAIRLALRGKLDPAWMASAAFAYHGAAVPRRRPAWRGLHLATVFANLPAIAWCKFAETRARRKTKYPVLGVAQINDEIFNN